MNLFSCISDFVFCSLASGSSGNCYYIGANNGKIIIDAGLPYRVIEKDLNKMELGMNDIDAFFLTHDHSDHVKGLDTLIDNTKQQIYASTECTDRLCSAKNNKHHRFSKINDDSLITIGELLVKPFRVSHDASGTLGYHITHKDKSLTLLTDCGRLDDIAKSHLLQSTSIVIEANYDRKMLYAGPYPYFLKQRISNGSGHLSNKETIDFVVENYTKPFDNIMFCHLSAHNNNAELLMGQFYNQLRFSKQTVNHNTSVFALPRTKQSQIIYL